MSAIALDRVPPAALNIPQLPRKSLAHIPGTDGWPVVGTTLAMLADPKGEGERLAARFGPVHRTRMFGFRSVSLLGPEANEFVLFDSARVFSSYHGLRGVLERLFPRGLLLLDLEEHRLQRKALSVAFKTGPMKSYLDSLNRGIASGIAQWNCGSRDIRFHPTVKKLTLDLAAASFLGTELGPEAAALNAAFIDMVSAIVAVVRKPIPGTKMARGLKKRAFMVNFFGRQIDARRAGDGTDIFTQLCKATTDEGALLTPQQRSWTT